MKRSHRKRRTRRALLAFFCVIFLALIVLSAWKIYSILHGYQEAGRRYGDLAEVVSASFTPAAPEPSALPAASSPSGEETPELPQASALPQERSPVSVDFEALRQISSDVVGWICLPDTVISYPVAQSGDNAFYLEHFLDGSRISGGTLFADCSCPSDFSGKNTIIYGHNMKDGSMFALIDDYADQNFYEEHPFLYLNTPTQNYRLDIFSGFTTDPLSFVYTTAFASTEDFAAFLRSLYAFSEIDCRTAVSPDDRIVILSTCTYSGEDVRFVVCGKLTAIG